MTAIIATLAFNIAPGLADPGHHGNSDTGSPPSARTDQFASERHGRIEHGLTLIGPNGFDTALATSIKQRLAITEDQGSLTFRVKHFNPDMTGWEEKDETMDFLLVEVGDNEVFFDGLTLRRTGTELRIFLSMKGRDGTVREEAFVFDRVS